ncbi:MAG: hypothetical protein KAX44_05825 [Candidatus Brocadiae bacterium]|nr:hypothetical protein [Candidatus Brocadiia bacterium]
MKKGLIAAIVVVIVVVIIIVVSKGDEAPAAPPTRTPAVAPGDEVPSDIMEAERQAEQEAIRRMQEEAGDVGGP